ncbi:histidinol-phosphate aminotransferase [Colwellia chukchiensis]|uniref:Histidinol-phosphate aminotransferase n=1 Tax=Colwellia chukchiensis TaxID=641665 RepID=A0A1H7KCE7_9GAMM|nr:histidinol-phosphate transaminase [Colwellia chukchiensis]SEK84508.1 histidinol-phosphate aminotransferase [Colwellia chukchiensis]
MSISNKLARKELLAMVPYQSARRLFASGAASQGQVWLNANEAAGAGRYQVNGDNINRYPDFQPENLLNAYSDYCGLTKAHILATRGADEGIELIIRAFCQAYQDNIIICPPTYGMYAISAENHGAGIISVPLTSELGLDIAKLRTQVGRAKVVFLCSPGNPTGNLLSKQDIASALELFSESAIVVVDEAYIEFCPEQTVLSWLAKYPQLVILRTLSKAFALAGLRCGFTLASPAIITLLSKVIAPYPIAAPVADIASTALAPSGLKEMSSRVQETNNLRAQLSAWLSEQPWCKQVFNADANFLLFRCQNQALKDYIFQCLVAQGILIRDQSKQPSLAHCLRISIGSAEELTLLQQTLSDSFADKTAPKAIKEN